VQTLAAHQLLTIVCEPLTSGNQAEGGRAGHEQEQD
jgi:hypothetical protein